MPVDRRKLEAKRIHVKLKDQEQPIEAFLIHRGGENSRVTVAAEFRDQLNVDKDGTVMVPNEMIQEVGEQIEPGNQHGGVPREVRTYELLEDPGATYKGQDEDGNYIVLKSDGEEILITRDGKVMDKEGGESDIVSETEQSEGGKATNDNAAQAAAREGQSSQETGAQTAAREKQSTQQPVSQGKTTSQQRR